MQRVLRVITLQGAIEKKIFRILVVAIIFSPSVVQFDMYSILVYYILYTRKLKYQHLIPVFRLQITFKNLQHAHTKNLFQHQHDVDIGLNRS